MLHPLHQNQYTEEITVRVLLILW